MKTTPFRPGAISLCMIVKNEEALLDKCLSSVHGLVDEIIVVDTGSTDRTVEIAQAHGARIEHFKWCDDFAAARNYSLGFARGEWILILDADESLNPADHAAIRALTTRGGDAFAFVLRNYFFSGNTSTFDKPAEKNDTGFNMEFPYYSDSTALRFWRRGPKFTNKIHELPTIREFEVVSPVIHHYGKMDTPREAAKRETYFRLAKEEAAAHPMNCQLHFSLAGEAYVLHEWETALEAAKAYMRLEPQQVPLMMILVAGCASAELGKLEHALYYFNAVLKAEPNHTLAMTEAAKAFFGLGHVNEAFGLIKSAIKISPNFSGAHMALMRMQEVLQDYPSAYITILRAAESNPHDPMLIKHLDRLLTMA